MDQQTRLLGRLVRIISETFEFRRTQESDQLIGVPTTEGMTLVFFGDPVAPVRCATEIARAVQSYSEMKLRMGIHSGPVYRVAGIDARTSVAGDGIKTAQRIMSRGEAGHILASKPVADTLSQLGNWTKCLYDLGEHEITPGARLQLFNLYTGEVGNPECPCELTASAPSSPAVATPAEAVLAPKRMIRPFFIIAAAVIVVGAAIAGYLALNRRSSPKEPPLLTAEFAENFVSLDRWNVPPSGWSFANQSLQVENQTVLGYAPEVNCADFTMTFNLTLMNDGGAAWALRVKDADNYYLFYLAGPGGTNPNTFLTYVVQDGKRVQKQADSVVVQLVARGVYQISIEVKGDSILHRIKSENPEFDEAGEWRKLGLIADNTYSVGSIGFRTVAGEKFVVRGLYVRPPDVELPK